MMNIVKKARAFYRQDGFAKTLGKIFAKIFRECKKLPVVLYEKMTARKKLQALGMRARGKHVYVVIPCIDWHIPLYQRPHQIAVELSKREDNFVLFLPDQYKYDNFAVCRQVNPALWLYSIRLKDALDAVLREAQDVTVLMSWTRHADVLEAFSYDTLIYEYIDEMSLFYYYDTVMEETHRRLMRMADVTVCTANKLYEQAKQVTDKAILCENAGDYSFFHENRDIPVHPLIRDQIAGYDLVMGYYGCLATWFDYDTIRAVAEQRRDWLIILVGYDFDGTLSQLDFPRHPNIVHVPAQPYTALPSFVAAFDVQLIPFKITEVTESTSPVKLFEYMASGKPILTSELPECRKYRSVLRYQDANSFIRQIENIRRVDKKDPYFSVLEAEALANTWQARVDQILAAAQK